MVRNVEEVEASFENMLKSLDTRRARDIKKLDEIDADLVREMGIGVNPYRSWVEKVKRYRDASTDAKVTDDEIIENYRSYVNELLNCINVLNVKGASMEEKDAMLEALGRRIQDLENENKELKELPRLPPRPVGRPPKPKEDEPVEADYEEEPEEEDDDDQDDTSEPDTIDSEPKEDEADDEPLDDKEESEEDENGEEKKIERKKEEGKKIYITDTQLEHLKEAKSRKYQLAKEEAMRLRRFHPEFSDYSTIEHRYYKVVAPEFEISMHALDPMWNQNFCRVCKKKINNNRVVCSTLCKSVRRRADIWIERHAKEILKMDIGLSLPPSKIKRQKALTRSKAKMEERQQIKGETLARNEVSSRLKDKIVDNPDPQQKDD